MKLDKSIISQWILLVGLNVVFILIFPFTLSFLQNPFPLITILLFILLQVYFLWRKKGQLFLLLMISAFSLYSLSDALDTHAISRKCAFETNKPVEQRNDDKIREEELNFESCINSMSSSDYLVYGLLK